MTCPVCGRDDLAYHRCNRPDCTDGRHVPSVSGQYPDEPQVIYSSRAANRTIIIGLAAVVAFILWIKS